MMRKNKREQIFTGRFDSNARGFGFVTVEGFERDLFIPQGCTGGAVYGDTVEVRITRGSLDESGHGDDGQGKRAEAEVTRILEHGVKMVVGTYHAFRRPVQKTYIKDYIMLGKRMVGKTVSLNIAGYTSLTNIKLNYSEARTAMYLCIGGFLGDAYDRSRLYDPTFTHMFRKGTED